MPRPGSNTWTIARREYLARIRSKSFWIATVALPLFLASIGILPSLLMFQGDRAHRLVLVDETGRLGDAVRDALSETAGTSSGGSTSSGGMRWAPFEIELLPASDIDRNQLNRRVLDGVIDAWIWIDDAALDDDVIEYHAESVSNFLTQERLERALSAAVRRWRLAAAGYDAEEVGELARPVELLTIRVTEKGEKAEGAEAGIILSYLLFFMLSLVLVIYGQQVMNGVLEEKTSRIVEVIVSTTRPVELMLGKLFGICGIALTQLGIWLATLVVVTLPGVVAAIIWIPDGIDVPTIGPAIVLHFLLHFLLGFFLYSTFYAAIGAAFNNLQEAQQFATLAGVFLVAPIFLFWRVLNDPDGTVSVATSLVPLFTPLLMMLRIAVKTPPAWQITAGYVVTAAFTWLMIWLGARIYRVGILMYGKKPTLRELWRWVRYA